MRIRSYMFPDPDIFAMHNCTPELGGASNAEPGSDSGAAAMEAARAEFAGVRAVPQVSFPRWSLLSWKARGSNFGMEGFFSSRSGMLILEEAEVVWGESSLTWAKGYRSQARADGRWLEFNEQWRFQTSTTPWRLPPVLA